MTTHKGSKRRTPFKDSFVKEYIKLECTNSCEAYRRSMYATDNMNKTTLTTNAYNALRDPYIADEIKRFQDSVKGGHYREVEDVIRELEDLAEADIIEFIDLKPCENSEDGYRITLKEGLNSFSDLPKRERKKIKKIKVSPQGGIELELYDRITAIDRISKLKGWDKVKVEVESVNMPLHSIIGKQDEEDIDE